MPVGTQTIVVFRGALPHGGCYGSLPNTYWTGLATNGGITPNRKRKHSAIKEGEMGVHNPEDVEGLSMLDEVE